MPVVRSFLKLYPETGTAELPKNRHQHRIGINLFPLELRGGGMKHYVLQLLPLLVRRTNHEFVLYHGLTGLPSIGGVWRDLSSAERARVRLVEIGHAHEIYGHAKDFDVYFCPLNGFEPQLLDRPTLATLADVQERFFPQYFSPGELAARGLVYPRVIHSVTTLLTISEFSKQTICSEFGADPDRVQVTHLAPNFGLLNAASEWPAGSPELPERFIFYPANTYPHKNHELLLHAMRRLKDQGHLSFKCVFSGHMLKNEVDIPGSMKKLGLVDDVIWLGHVSPGALRYLYDHALAMCFPSEFEGFGMPIVEAMYLGCPVVANRAASIPEIGGDAALYVAPDPKSWAESLLRVAGDESLRTELKVRGLQQAQRFNVERLADETIQLIDETVEKFHAEPQLERPVGFVVIGRGCNRSLEHSLKSIALVAKDADEILVLENRDSLEARVLSLIENFDQVRVVDRASDWTARLTADVVFVLPAGASVLASAPAAAAAAFARNPAAQLMVGEVIYINPQGDYLTLSYTRFEAGSSPALEAVAWRRSALVGNSHLLSKSCPISAALAELPGEAVAYLSRTFSTRVVWPDAPLPRRPLIRRVLGRLRREVASRLLRSGLSKA